MNTVKNMVIVTLVAIITFLVMEDGNGVLSAQEIGMPVFVMVLGMMVVMMMKGDK